MSVDDCQSTSSVLHLSHGASLGPLLSSSWSMSLSALFVGLAKRVKAIVHTVMDNIDHPLQVVSADEWKQLLATTPDWIEWHRSIVYERLPRHMQQRFLKGPAHRLDVSDDVVAAELLPLVLKAIDDRFDELFIIKKDKDKDTTLTGPMRVEETKEHSEDRDDTTPPPPRGCLLSLITQSSDADLAHFISRRVLGIDINILNIERPTTTTHPPSSPPLLPSSFCLRFSTDKEIPCHDTTI